MYEQGIDWEPDETHAKHLTHLQKEVVAPEENNTHYKY
jgi:hypothetical protein